MGAGASANLPATVDKPTALALAGDNFDEIAFDKAAATNGTVSREQFIAAARVMDDGQRAAVTTALRDAFQKNKGEFMAHTDQHFMHGWLYSGPMTSAKVLWKSDQKPRKDHAAPDWLTATEFEDVSAVMDAKVKQLAALMRLSKRTVVYSGAGISASAVGQAALSGVNKTGWLDKTAAKPTMTHHALSVLGRAGWIHGWVQQNHDGLPQKAGFPQERICEVHGSWYDPSNPVRALGTPTRHASQRGDSRAPVFGHRDGILSLSLMLSPHSLTEGRSFESRPDRWLSTAARSRRTRQRGWRRRPSR